MFKKFLAPFLILSVVLTAVITTALNVSATSEINQDYFIKPIPRADLVVVEPNYGRFYHPSEEIKGDASGEILYKSLEDIKQDYEIQNTEMISFERKGQIIPNLYVHVNPINENRPEQIASRM